MEKFFFAVIVLPIAVLCGAMIDGLPYTYFRILRWVICVTAGINAFLWWTVYDEKKNTLCLAGTLIFGGVALLFNPLIPFYMKREQWVQIDIAAIVPFVIQGIYLLKEEKASKQRLAAMEAEKAQQARDQQNH